MDNSVADNLGQTGFRTVSGKLVAETEVAALTVADTPVDCFGQLAFPGKS